MEINCDNDSNNKGYLISDAYITFSPKNLQIKRNIEYSTTLVKIK